MSQIRDQLRSCPGQRRRRGDAKQRARGIAPTTDCGQRANSPAIDLGGLRRRLSVRLASRYSRRSLLALQRPSIEGIALLGFFLERLVQVVELVWVFRTRARINEAFGLSDQRPEWLGVQHNSWVRQEPCSSDRSTFSTS